MRFSLGGRDGEGALTASRDVLPKVPILLEIHISEPSSSKRKSAKPDRKKLLPKQLFRTPKALNHQIKR